MMTLLVFGHTVGHAHEPLQRGQLASRHRNHLKKREGGYFFYVIKTV